MYQSFYLTFSDWDYFYSGEILGNESFRTEIVSLFSTCQMFNFSVTVIKKLQGKAIPLQAWTGPEGSRRLRLPDFKTIGT